MKTLKATLILFAVIIFPFAAQAAGVGDEAPPFTLKDMEGKEVSMEGLKGKVVFLDFWATWCAPCKEELPELDKIYQKYQKEGLQVIAISVDKSAGSVEEFVKKRPLSFPVLHDGSGKLASDYKLVGMPVAFIIGKDGMVSYRQAGYSKSFLPAYEKKIAELLGK